MEKLGFKMECRVCGSKDLEQCIDLGNQPWCNNFLSEEEIGKEPTYPLRVVYCNKCHTAQLDYTVKKEVMFGDHTYLSGVTSALSSHFRKIAHDTIKRERDNGVVGNIRVLDIGSNDGTQLKHFKDMGAECLGVESSKRTAEIANNNGICTLNKFFNTETAQSIGGKFNIINAAGVFFHLEELHSVCDGIKLLLAKDGTFTVQFLYMKNIMENNAFDQIYHEHLLYYTLETIQALLRMHELEVYDAYISPIHGGSVIASVGHRGTKKKTSRLLELERQEVTSGCNKLEAYKNFAERIETLKNTELEILHQWKDNGKTVFGLGAPVKGNTLLNYFGVNSSLIQCLTERNKLRKGLYAPGSHLRIVMEDEIKDQPDVYYVLAWNFKEEILARNSHLVERGLIFHFPVNP